MVRNDVGCLKRRGATLKRFASSTNAMSWWVFGWFRRRTLGVEDAMDLTAETFAQALVSL
jgi:hypothetical protein